MGTARAVSIAARRRLIAAMLVDRLGRWLGAACGGVLVVALAGKVIGQEIPVAWVAAGACAAGVLGAVAATWRARPSLLDAAVHVDRVMRLRDRVSTALVLRPGEDPFVDVAVADGERAAAGVRVERTVPVRWGRWWAVWPALLACAIGVERLVPDLSPSRRAAETARRAEAARVVEVGQRVEAAAEAAGRIAAETGSGSGGMGGPAQPMEVLREIERELAAAAEGRRAGVDADSAIARAAGALEELARDQSARAEELSRRADEVMDELASLPEPTEVGAESALRRALRSGDLESARRSAMEMLHRGVLNDDARRSEAARELSRLAEDLRQLAEAKRPRQAAAVGEEAGEDGAPPAETASGGALARDADQGATGVERGGPEEPGAAAEVNGADETRELSERLREAARSLSEPEPPAATGSPADEAGPDDGREEGSRRAPESPRQGGERRGAGDAGTRPMPSADGGEASARTQEKATVQPGEASRPGGGAPRERVAAEPGMRDEPGAAGRGSAADPKGSEPGDAASRVKEPGRVGPAGTGEGAGASGGDSPARGRGSESASGGQKQDAAARESGKARSGGAEASGSKSNEGQRGEKIGGEEGRGAAGGPRPTGEGAAKQAATGTAGASGSGGSTGAERRPAAASEDSRAAAPAGDRSSGVPERSGEAAGPGVERRPAEREQMSGAKSGAAPGPEASSADRRVQGGERPMPRGDQPGNAEGGRADTEPPTAMPRPRDAASQDDRDGGSKPPTEAQRRAFEQLGRQLQRLAGARDQARKHEQNAEDLMKEAQRLYDAASPEQREQMRQWTRQFAPRSEGEEPGAGVTRRASADGSGRAREEGAGGGPGGTARDRRPVRLPSGTESSVDAGSTRTEPVDARRGGDTGESGDGPEEQVVAEWLGRGVKGRGDGSGAAIVEQRLREAARSAERAIDDRVVPGRYDRILREYFNRLPRKLGAASGEGDRPAPAAVPAGEDPMGERP